MGPVAEWTDRMNGLERLATVLHMRRMASAARRVKVQGLKRDLFNAILLDLKCAAQQLRERSGR